MKKIYTLIVLFFLIQTVSAQVTTSGIDGQVKEESGYLPGATVLAVHLPTGARYGTVTNEDGRFTLQGLRPGGPYQITISFIGYQTEKLENITLKLGESFVLNTVLKPTSQNLEEVLVIGEAGNSSKNGTATNFSMRQINALPTVSRSITDMTRLTPQASVNSNGAISFAGANNRYNSFQIDGAMNNDVFGLTSNGTNGGQASVEPVSFETIEQIQVNIAPFDVRQSGFTGGGINAVTKSGTNEFHGTAYFFGNNQGLTGKTPGTLREGQKRERLVKQHDYQFGITVGGPILKDKLFFFANYERTDKSYPTSNNLNDGSNFTEEKTNQVLAHLQTLTDGTYSADFDKKDVYTHSDKASLKLDWNINERHKLTARYSYVGAKKLSFPRSAGKLYASDAAFEFNNKTNSWIVELNSRIKDAMNNELRASYVRVRDSRDPQGNPFPSITIKDGSNDALTLGTEYSSMANSLNQDIISLTDNFSWLVGNHHLTFGTHNELYFFKNLFIQNLYGSYTFNSIDNFLQNKVDLFFYGQSNIERTGKADYAPEFGAMQLGFYIQDNWNICDNFNLTYGVRMDIPLLLDRPTENPDFNSSDIALEYDVKTNAKPKARPLWSPRVGFHWTPDEDRHHLIRGGVGIFTGRIPFVWLSNSFSNTGMEFLKYAYYSNSQLPNGIYFNTNPHTQYEMLQNATAATTEVDIFDKKFKFTQNLRFNLAYEYTFNFGMKATLEGLYSKTLNDIVYKDLNIEQTGETVASAHGLDFDDRPMFKSKVNPAYTNFMYLGNTHKGYTYNFSLKLDKSFKFGLDATAAYTFARSKSVNSAGSSVAFSNWRYNEVKGDPNNPELGFSDFNIPHRVVASISYSKAYAKHFRTTATLVYTGQSGVPYNVTYYGDLNGDGSNGNDLIFIPTDAQIDQMQFSTNNTDKTADQQRADLKQFLDNDKYMKKHRGEYYKRNAANLDFEHHFDLRILQDFKFKAGNRTHTFQVSFDVLNIGNMFNKNWGKENFLSNNTYSPISYDARTKTFQYLEGGNYQPVTISDFSSRWRGQLGIKYIF